jgi:hypothetical protein
LCCCLNLIRQVIDGGCGISATSDLDQAPDFAEAFFDKAQMQLAALLSSEGQGKSCLLDGKLDRVKPVVG